MGMNNTELIYLIKAYQRGNREQFHIIYEIFEKLIYHYTYRMKNDEDMFQELNAFLIELLAQLPLDSFSPDDSAGLQQYIAVSIRNRYISYSRQKQARETLSVNYCEQIATCGENSDNWERRMILSEALSLLTEKQKQVILCKYIYGCTDDEISEDLHISRQAVNRLKTRGLTVLRKFLKE